MGPLDRATHAPAARFNPSLAQNDTVGVVLAQLGIELPAPSAPGGNYLPAMRAGDLVFLSGAGPARPDGSMVTGKVGETETVN